MRVRVESHTVGDKPEQVVRFNLDGRQVEIAETLDQWHGADYRYFKVKGDDGNLYILRHDEPKEEWELTMFQQPGAPESAAERDMRKPLH